MTTNALAIDLGAPCWLWQGGGNGNGYGRTGHMSDGKQWYAHRYMWTTMRGPIPEGMTIDHLCRVTACVNPQHLEVVTMRENILRGNSACAVNARKTHCPRGHEFTPENIAWDRGRRGCRICKRLKDARRPSRAVSQSSVTEHERETRQEICLDNAELQEYLG